MEREREIPTKPQSPNSPHRPPKRKREDYFKKEQAPQPLKANI